MVSKLSFIAGFGAGYVLGARAGKERYQQIASKARDVMHSPAVQHTAEQAQHLAKEKAEEAQHLAKQKAGEAQDAVKSKLSSSDEPSGVAGSGTSTQPGSFGAPPANGAPGAHLA